MIHPYSGNAVPVCDEASVSVSDNGGVGSIDPDSAEVFLYHLSYSVGIHEEERQAVLPQITPASSASTVIVVRKERAAEQAAEEGLEADPFHKTVEVGVTCGESGVDFLSPVSSGPLKCGSYLVRSIIFLKHFSNVVHTVFHAQKKDVFCFFPGTEQDLWKAESPHRLSAGGVRLSRHSGIVFIYSAGMRVGSSFAEKFLYGGIEAFRSLAAASASIYIVDFVVWPVSPLIKGHGRADKDSVCRGPYPVQHGSYIPVVPYIIRAPPVDRDCCIRGQFLGLIGKIPDGDVHDLRIVLRGDK